MCIGSQAMPVMQMTIRQCKYIFPPVTLNISGPIHVQDPDHNCGKQSITFLKLDSYTEPSVKYIQA